MAFLTNDAIDPGTLLREVRRDSDGGLAVFTGVVRNHDEGRPVDHLEYVAYDAMAEKEMARIAAELERRFPEVRVSIRHRLGDLRIGDVAVVVAAAAPHRGEAFDACRAGIEAIKARVPIWKKQFGPDGAIWVEPCAAAE